MKRTVKGGTEDIRIQFQKEPVKALRMIQDSLLLIGVTDQIVITSKKQAVELIEALQNWVDIYGDRLD